MASGAVLAQYRQLYGRADKALQQWDNLHCVECARAQAHAVGVVTTCINIIQRLPALQDADAYGGSQLLLAVQQKLLGKQMQSFEAHMARLRDLIAELAGVAKMVSKLAADGARMLRELRVTLDSPTAQQQIGAAPSLADCVLGLQSLRQMLADECRLHAALCTELTPAASDEDLQAVQQLWADQPNVLRQDWQDIRLRVSLTGQHES